MISSCKHCRQSFEIRPVDLAFYETVGPRIAGVTIPVPSPQLCPACRRKRRMSYRNERKLYRRTCDRTKKPVISLYSPDKPNCVVAQSEWWSDTWSAVEFGLELSFDREFYVQFAELRRAVPTKALSAVNCENCEFTNELRNSKNCYHVFGGIRNEDCYYCFDSALLKDCVETWWSRECEISIGVFCSIGLYDCRHCSHCNFSNNLTFCRNCNNCKDCLGCSALDQKQYCVFNQQYSKEDYAGVLKSFNRGSHKQLQKLKTQVTEYFHGLPHRAVDEFASEDSTGNMLVRSKGCYECFTIADSEYCAYCMECARDKNCSDIDFSYDCQALIYEATASSENHSCAFVNNSQNCNECYCIDECYYAKNCFGCVGLRNSEFCILNRQYSKNEYEALVPRLIEHMRNTGEWGEFFPMAFSPFGYNESTAHYYYPLSREEALMQGATWSDFQSPRPQTKTVLSAGELPDHIDNVPDSILDAAIECETTKELFRITSAELAFYRRHKIPLPRQHPEERYRELESLRNPLQLWTRSCDKCGSSIRTTYSPERKETIFCSECYLAEKFYG